MLLIKILLTLFSLSLLAEEGVSIVKYQQSYYLKTSLGDKLSLTYTGTPKLLKVSSSKELTIIDYYAGSFGTSDLVEMNNRIVIKGSKVIIDAPFKYLNKKDQPVWKIRHSDKSIKIKDPIGSNQKVSFR